jgi:hypothetical protein
MPIVTVEHKKQYQWNYWHESDVDVMSFGALETERGVSVVAKATGQKGVIAS